MEIMAEHRVHRVYCVSPETGKPVRATIFAPWTPPLGTIDFKLPVSAPTRCGCNRDCLPSIPLWTDVVSLTASWLCWPLPQLGVITCSDVLATLVDPIRNKPKEVEVAAPAPAGKKPAAGGPGAAPAKGAAPPPAAAAAAKKK